MKAFLLVAVIFVSANAVYGIEVKCKGVEIKITEDQMMPIKECAKSLGVTEMKDFNPGNAGCFSKCVMEKKGLVDGDGKPHKENIMKAMDQGLPDSLKDAWKMEMEKCLDNEGSKIKNPDDATCSSYLPLTLCAHGAYMNMCK